MDPLSALAVAAAVVQFIDFTGSLVTGTYEIHKSTPGGSQSNGDIRSITGRLKALNGDLCHSIGSVPDASKCENEVAKLCLECTVVADDLLSVLDQLSTNNKHSVWNSFCTCLRTMWSQQKIDSLQKRLDSFRQQIFMHILASLREAMTHNAATSLVEMRKISQDILKLNDQSSKWQSELIEAINRSHWSQCNNALLLPIKLKLYDEVDFSDQLLAVLRYNEMKYRSEGIGEAYEETYEWIFNPPPEEQDWGSFIEWLVGTEPLYWITGKAGSGKSTLMKLICKHKITSRGLRKWAQSSGYDIFISSFYFWCSGTEIQMSQTGLLRTLIHNSLTEMRYLIPIVFSNRFETYMIFGDKVALQEPWSWMELVQAFQILQREAKKRHMIRRSDGEWHNFKPRKLAFFIDGLDEYNGSHSELVTFIQGLIDQDVKVCVSSRPWNVFEDAFRHQPSLRLEDVTTSDIKRYVSSKLSANPGFGPLQALEPEYASQLVENITIKSSGIFLWVCLVTESLLEGLSDGERLSDLQRRLDALPGDLESVFWRILKSLKDDQFERSSQLFQIAQAAIAPLSLLQLSFADEEDIEYSFKLQISPITEQQRNARAERMRRRVNACTKGLLEVREDLKGMPYTIRTSGKLPDAPVGYLHRTVRDFMQQSQVSQKFLDATKQSSFDPNLRLRQAYLCQLKQSDVDTLRADTVWHWITYGVEHAIRHDPNGTQTLNKFLDEIDMVATTLTTAKDRRGRSLLERLSTAETRQLPHWASNQRHIPERTSFLHLATEWQLNSYIHFKLEEMGNTRKIVVATSLLETAITTAETKDILQGQTSLYQNQPNVKLVQILLDSGADFASTDLLAEAIRLHKWNQPLMREFLLHDADPIVFHEACSLDPEMKAYVKNAYDEMYKKWCRKSWLSRIFTPNRFESRAS